MLASSIDMDFDLVVKIKYGESLRRFNTFVNGGDMDLDMVSLRSKILNIFKLNEDADITLTYLDEDKDIVTLVDDSDLRDAVLVQRLNPLRISVAVNDGSQNIPPSGNSTPLRSTEARNLPTSFGANIEDCMRTVPEPVRGALLKLYHDCLSKATLSSPLLNEILECAKKLGVSSLGTCSEGQEGCAPLPTPTNPSGQRGSYNCETGLETCSDHPSPPNVRSKTADTSEQATHRKNAGCNVPPKNFAHLSGSSPFLASSSKPPAPQAPRTTEVVDGGKNSEFSDNINPVEIVFNNPGNSWMQPSIPNVMPYCPAYPHYGHLSKRRHARFDKSHRSFHKGVQCDGCGMLPIVGPRYKSKVNEDYDLCNVCFMEMGNEADYSQIDHPTHYSPRPYIPRFRRASPCHSARSFRSKLDSRFVKDVTVLDGTIIAPDTPFTKIWRMRNDGTVAWLPGTHLVWIAGNLLGAKVSAELEVPSNGCQVDGELDIAVDFRAPSLPGRYISYWKLASPDGQKFGQRVWVLIHVVNSLESDVVPSGSYPSLNLNLPPESSITQKGKEVIDEDIEPIKSIDLEHSDGAAGEQVKADMEYLNGKQKNDQCDGDNKTVNGVSYPFIELLDVHSPVESTPPLPAVSVPVEDSLLKELEEMGFKQVDINKEVLRKNEYDLENSLDELCAVSEWDPLLEELQEMGFADRQRNKKLLMKNGGSIKRVVLDLIAEETACPGIPDNSHTS